MKVDSEEILDEVSSNFSFQLDQAMLMTTLDANLLALQTLLNVHSSELVHCSIKNVLHNVTIPTRKKRNIACV